MTLVELLQLAAKSVNIDLVYQNDQAGRYKSVSGATIWVPWAPHEDGADAMYLVAVHNMQINGGKITCRIATTSRILERSYPHNDQADIVPEEAVLVLCMAITEMAADIGSRMA